MQIELTNPRRYHVGLTFSLAPATGQSVMLARPAAASRQKKAIVWGLALLSHVSCDKILQTLERVLGTKQRFTLCRAQLRQREDPAEITFIRGRGEADASGF
jgi:hypothetical protein